MVLTAYYQQLHFKYEELELFYNMPVISSDDVSLKSCHHVPNLMCSRAHELASDKCITERKCEIHALRSELFTEKGIHGPTLQGLDKKLRKK